ncbi:MarR family winged helix-turn-helix transcriptional regulator [Paenarthrobacter ilicis]|uniref:DNA-binding MarR family transcriptional regulator n=1 Tax=Paenarthrobacter ilicis TaxID=43665 RepID=A0ABX0THV7_9MICC|nr:MarR family winged helix-turn-helix transcriptional regulator [Paenarthrobacter ilicis]MBM7793142.1 DNA-binding MarR family transcriptional regulator [Paenarthrobacter ilicis]NIJ02082.1 DNA-binding MarR family transcriptional regulator [Paenarthrobacter ilicis]
MTTPDVGRWPNTRLLSAAARLVEQHWTERLRALGLGMQAVTVLDALDAGGPASQDDLATALRLQPRLINASLLRLELRGCVTRRMSEPERSSQAIDITTAGKELLQECRDLEGQVLEGLAVDMDGLRGDLAAIIRKASGAPE